MNQSSEYGSRGSAYGEFEPYNIGFFIDKAWFQCWPRVIGRAWLYQLEFADKARLVEQGQMITMATPDDRWYMDLLSHDPYRTKKALEAEGIAYLADDKAEQEHWQKWIFTRIIVRTRNQAVKIKVGPDNSDSNGHNLGNYADDKLDGYVRNKPWDDVKATGHFLVLAIPPTPQEAKYVGKALADYMATNKVYPLA